MKRPEGLPLREPLSKGAQAFLDRPLFPGALWLGVGLLVSIVVLSIASLFIKAGPKADKTIARTIAQMFLRR